MKPYILFPTLLVGIILLSGCPQYGPPATPTGELQPTPTEQLQPTGELREFTVEGSEFQFSPAVITVGKGDRVKITFKNVGSTGHNFVIGGLGVGTSVIPAGSTDTVEFTADRSGTFAFYCSVPGHRPAGMEGQVTVS